MTERLDEIRDSFQILRFQVIVYLSSVLFGSDELTFRQDAQVFGNGLTAYVKVLGHRSRSDASQCDQSDQCATRRIGYGLKNVSSHHVVALNVKPISCQYNATFWLHKVLKKKC